MKVEGLPTYSCNAAMTQDSKDTTAQMHRKRRLAKRLAKKLPMPIRRRLFRAAKKVFPKLSASTTRVTPSVPLANSQDLIAAPTDPLHLSAASPVHLEGTLVGRAAAGTGFDPETPDRIYRALHGRSVPTRNELGGRPIGGILGRDLRTALESENFPIHPYIPGTSAAVSKHVEIVVIDLDGFDGVWAGALDAHGVGLFRELVLALRTAQEHGVSCWVVARGGNRHKLGALALQKVDGVGILSPGVGTAEQLHFTENPGEAPAGVLDIIRSLEVQS